jgi:hypothetical protein
MYICLLIDDPPSYYEEIPCDSQYTQYNSSLNILKTTFGVKDIVLEVIDIQNVILISVRVFINCAQSV